MTTQQPGSLMKVVFSTTYYVPGRVWAVGFPNSNFGPRQTLSTLWGCLSYHAL